MVQLTIDGKESEAKIEWLAGGIPEHSVVSLFFVRTQACICQVFEKGIRSISSTLHLAALCPHRNASLACHAIFCFSSAGCPIRRC